MGMVLYDNALVEVARCIDVNVKVVVLEPPAKPLSVVVQETRI